MATLSILKVLALPETLVANAMYMVAGADEGTFEFHVANAEGTATRRVDQSKDILNRVVTESVTAPDPATTDSSFWWDPSTGGLFVKYENEGAPTWVEAMPSSILELDGNGTSNMAARADHTHNSLEIEADW